MRTVLLTVAFYLMTSLTALAMVMNHDGMYMDEKGMIMHANENNLPKDCPKISEEVTVTIRAGHKHATKFPGKMFAFDHQEWHVKPCAKVKIHFVNDDQIRHQLMVHGLPGYLYPNGMLHLELYGQGELTASLIVDSRKKTYLVHCEIPQHMEKGMKGQLKVGGGDKDFESIPGISEPVNPDTYPVRWPDGVWIILVTCIVMGLLLPIAGWYVYKARRVN